MQSMALNSQEENMLAPTPLPSGQAQNYGSIENVDGVTGCWPAAMAGAPVP